MRRGIASLFLLLLSLGVAAAPEEKVLIESLPANVDAATALKAAHDALEYRTWKVVAQDDHSVTATISRQAIDGRIRIRFKDARLVYTESARGKSKMDFTGRMTPSSVELPERWINYLRSDITESLQKVAAALAATPQAPTAINADAGPRRSTSTERLKELKQMLDSGLISADEYAKKKAEILRDL